MLELDAHKGFLRILCFAPGNRSLATGSDDGTVKLLDLADGAERVLLSGAGVIHSLVFDPAGKRLAIGHEREHDHEWDTRVKLLDLKTGNMRTVGIRGGGRGSGLRFSPDGAHFAIASLEGVALCDPATGKQIRLLRDPRQSAMRSVVFSGDGHRVVSLSDSGRLCVWDHASGRLERTLGQQSYSLLLRTAPSTIEGPEPLAPTPFTAQRRLGGVAHLEIRRDGALLRDQVVPIASLPPGPLRMDAQREANRLTFRVEGMEPIVFEESSFFLESPGVFALAWPTDVPLLKVRASQQLLPPESNAVERADRLYAKAQFAEALVAYQEQALGAGTELLQECRHKTALCHLRLGREDQAARIFEQVGRETGDRWPALALCELWLLRASKHQQEQADAIFEVLHVRFGLDRLPVIVPGELRGAILRAYDSNARATNLYRHDPARIASLQRAQQIAEYLTGGSGSRSVSQSHRLARAYHAEGNLEKALQVLEKTWGDRIPVFGGQIAILEERSWILRLQGKAAVALGDVDRFYAQTHPITRAHPISILTERARILVALHRDDEAEKDLLEMFRRDPNTAIYRNTFTAGKLMLGLLRQRRGDEAGARAAWTEGLIPREEWDPNFGFEFLYTLILAALTDRLTDADAEAAMERLGSRPPIPGASSSA